MLESKFQRELRKDLKDLFKGCMIFKMDSASHGAGIPDLLVLYKNTWFALEVKQSATAKRQPNQPWYVETLDHMSFAAFIHPGNREEILHELCEAFGVGRATLDSKR